MSNNISFETGLKYFTINGDPDRKIYFDPTDFGMIDRLEAAAKAIGARANSMEINAEDPLSTARELDAFARKQVDAAFPRPVCDTVFGNACCISVTPSGYLMVESFLHSAAKVIRREMEGASAAAERRQGKYLDKYQNRQNSKQNRKRSGKRK